MDYNVYVRSICDFHQIFTIFRLKSTFYAKTKKSAELLDIIIIIIISVDIGYYYYY